MSLRILRILPEKKTLDPNPNPNPSLAFFPDTLIKMNMLFHTLLSA